MIGPTRRGFPNSAGENGRVGGSHGTGPRKFLIFDPELDYACVHGHVPRMRIGSFSGCAGEHLV